MKASQEAARQRLYCSPNDELLFKRARTAAVKLRGRLCDAARKRETHRCRGLIIKLLSSHACKLAAVHHANRQMHPECRVPSSALQAIADRLDPWRGSNEPVRMRSEPKASGGHRFIAVFGIEHRSLQTLVKWALQAWVGSTLLPQQHVLQGGRSAAVLAVKRMIEEGGHKHAIELDIKDCFGSISVKWLKENLSLPPKVTEATCTLGSMHIVAVDKVAQTHPQRSRTGLPQGSIASPLLAEFVVARILSSAPLGASIQTYVDNLFCSARTERELRSYHLTLERHIKTHPAGFFQVRTKGIKALRHGLPFLGYWLLKKRKLQIDVREITQEKLANKIESLWWERSDLDDIQRRREADRILSSWLASYILWPNALKFIRKTRKHARFLVGTRAPLHDSQSSLEDLALIRVHRDASWEKSREIANSCIRHHESGNGRLRDGAYLSWSQCVHLVRSRASLNLSPGSYSRLATASLRR